MLGFPLSFYWLSGVKWIRMQDVKPQTLVETFEQANYNSIPEYNVSLITLLTYPVNMHSWAYLQRYEETANYFTKNVIDVDGVITDFPGLKGAHLARLRPWWPHCFTFCRKQSVPYRSSLFTENGLQINARDGISFPRPEIWKISGGACPQTPPWAR